MRTCAIVNLHSSTGRTGNLWPAIERRLTQRIGPVETLLTDAPMAATRLTAQALRAGADRIIAVGGDGTVNEVVNGFFDGDRPINDQATLGLLTMGTGCDFRRTFGLPDDLEGQIARLEEGEVRPIDIGKAAFVDHHGEERVRYFDNIASFGLSGATDQAVNELTTAKKLGGKFAFKWGMIKALFTYRNQPVRVQIDDTFDQVLNVKTVAVCNGQYFGGSMHMAPEAKPDDGLFDVIMVTDVGGFELLLKSGSIYKGKHLKYPEVSAAQGRKVVALPEDGADDVLLDVDGEAPGRLPATFEILPKALRLIA